jgi:hypothetical protein
MVKSQIQIEHQSYQISENHEEYPPSILQRDKAKVREKE